MTCNNYNGCRGSRSFCLFLIPAILIALLTFTVGLIVGAALFGVILANLAAFIVLAVVFFVLLVIWAIVYFCRRRNRYDD